MSSFNDRINQVKLNNFNTKPVNLPQFQNPYLLLSKNTAYNKLANNKLINNKNNKNNKNQNNIKNIKNITNGIDEEDLARHAMGEVYKNVGERRDIRGYTIDRSFSTPEHVVYVGNNGILLGLRGSASPKDFVADAQIGLKTLSKRYPDSLSNTLLNRYSRDDAIYEGIRKKYPNKHITMSGHSLGNNLGMEILRNHKGDNNISFYGYNGWLHQSYSKDRRAKHIKQAGDLVSMFTPNNKTLAMNKDVREDLEDLGEGVLSGQTTKFILAQTKKRVRNKLQKQLLQNKFIQEEQQKWLLEGKENKTPREAEATGETWRDDGYERLEEAYPEANNVQSILRDNDLDDLADESGHLFINGGDAEKARLINTIDPINSQILSPNTVIDDESTKAELQSFLESNGFDVKEYDDYVNPVEADIEALTNDQIEGQIEALAGLGMGEFILSAMAVGAVYDLVKLYMDLHKTDNFPIKNNLFGRKKKRREEKMEDEL